MDSTEWRGQHSGCAQTAHIGILWSTLSHYVLRQLLMHETRVKWDEATFAKSHTSGTDNDIRGVGIIQILEQV